MSVKAALCVAKLRLLVLFGSEAQQVDAACRVVTRVMSQLGEPRDEDEHDDAQE